MASSMVAIGAIAAPVAVATAQQPREFLARAVGHFEAGRVTESAAEFDRLVKADPASAPHLWQRGIALYYAARYGDCRRQFELHRTVNPNDVENAAWHFLCVARAESPAAARKAILPVGPDARVPMRQIYDLFRGTSTPDAVMRAAGARPDGVFFAELYLGLYFEAMGEAPRALEHIKAAAAERYADAGGYMHTVAKVHLVILQRRR